MHSRNIAAGRAIVIAALVLSCTVQAETPDTVFIEELTWTELRDLMDGGTTTIIVPTAGTEQNGPHMVLGKHRFRMEAGAEAIARKLGNTVVAPVITYVPEGSIDPPEGHMRFPGTISIPPEVFKSVLEYTARSLRVHGFRYILFIGDSGPNQRPMQEVAEALSAEWKADGTRVLFISDWYFITSFDDWLRKQGEPDEAIGTHAGLSDTALLLAVAPQHVRMDRVSPGKGMEVDGVTGDPTHATAEMGRIGFDMEIDQAVRQIRALMARDSGDTK